MICDIFIRSYHKDFEWLNYCLRSIRTYCRGFRRVILVVPGSSAPKLGNLRQFADQIFCCCEYRDDYLGQQVTKIYADEYTDAEYICHIDSDCMFWRRICPEELIPDSRPRLACTPYSELPGDMVWKRITEKFLAHRLEYNFMRRQPLVFPRWLYFELRNYAQRLHSLSIEEYVISQPPRGFSEFNALAAYAFLFHRNAFTWERMGAHDPNEHLCKWYWSWGGLTPSIRRELLAILDSGSKSMNSLRLV